METNEKIESTMVVHSHQFTAGGSSNGQEIVAVESPVTIILNNREIVTLLCSPADLDCLAIGFLVSEGLLNNKGEIKNTLVDDRRGIVRVNTTIDNENTNEILFKRLVTSGCGRGAAFYQANDMLAQVKVESRTMVTITDIIYRMREFQRLSSMYRTTGGVHSAALYDSTKLVCFKEDIGRHNAIDKIFGECLLKDIPMGGCIVFTSGRVSSEVVIKVARRNIPILISKSAPLSLGIELADKLGVTLIGFVRGQRMNVYTNEWRVLDPTEFFSGGKKG